MPDFIKGFRDALNTITEVPSETKLKLHDEGAWLSEIIYKSTNDAESDIRIVTNVVAKKNKIYIRDPSMSMSLWPRNVADHL